MERQSLSDDEAVQLGTCDHLMRCDEYVVCIRLVVLGLAGNEWLAPGRDMPPPMSRGYPLLDLCKPLY